MTFSAATGSTYQLPIIPGQSVSIQWQSGMIQFEPGAAETDAIGNTTNAVDANSDNGLYYYPSYYIPSSDYPAYLTELVGVFTTDTGSFAGMPFVVGDARTLVVPDGASQLQLGVNDDLFSDNQGSWTVEVSTGNSTKAQAAPLDVSLDDSTIVPTLAPNLNLAEIFGTESLNVGLTVTDNSDSDISQVDDLVLRASRDDTATNGQYSGPVIYRSSQAFSLTSGDSTQITAKAEVPRSLSPGTPYYITAEFIPVGKASHDGDLDQISTDTTGDTFEFVGTPSSNPSVFSDGTYFNFITDLVNGNLAVEEKNSSTDVTNGQSFTGAWEVANYPNLSTSDLTPTTDPVVGNHPTIGVGLDLSAVPSSMTHDVATDFVNYYAANYPDDDTLSSIPEGKHHDQAVINAVAAESRHPDSADQSLSQDQALSLYNERYQISSNSVNALFSGTTLTNDALIALTDIQYNNKKGLKDFGKAVRALSEKKSTGPDYLVAAFNIVDAKRTTQAPGLTTRTESEFQELLSNSSNLIMFDNS